ncbi:hypothetical protein, partial [Paenibacillus sp. Aloe-11]|uniref:hypothetical protein n=1 Tax=Paenibacillus sp. Aloe-11 TaxID=1050222 RepID=UPI001E52E981
MLSLLLLFCFASNTSAATIKGTLLPNPEKGWQRIKPNNENFTYTGQYQHLDQNYYQSKWQTSGSAIKFNFIGSKMRYIMNTWWSNSANITIKIDGKPVVTNLDTRGKDEGLAKIGFEVLNLEFKEHYVEIINNRSEYLINRGIDFDDTGEIKPYNPVITPPVKPVPSVPLDLKATPENLKIILNWTADSGAISYNVKRSTTKSGPYTTIATSVTESTYSDINVVNGTTYYYVVSALNSAGESNNSYEVSATPVPSSDPTPSPGPSGDRAILVVTMDTGLDKEFDLSKKELEAFIAWYDAKDAGRGASFFA